MLCAVQHCCQRFWRICGYGVKPIWPRMLKQLPQEWFAFLWGCFNIVLLECAVHYLFFPSLSVL